MECHVLFQFRTRSNQRVDACFTLDHYIPGTTEYYPASSLSFSSANIIIIIINY